MTDALSHAFEKGIEEHCSLTESDGASLGKGMDHFSTLKAATTIPFEIWVISRLIILQTTNLLWARGQAAQQHDKTLKLRLQAAGLFSSTAQQNKSHDRPPCKNTNLQRSAARMCSQKEESDSDKSQWTVMTAASN